jgi:uncharacterized membrane protein
VHDVIEAARGREVPCSLTREVAVTTPADALAEVPLFSLLSEAERVTLAERVDVVTFEVGAIVFHYGDPGDSMYVVREGLVELSFKNDTGEKIVVEMAHAGDFFGEMSLLDGESRMATAKVIEAVNALKIDRGDLHELVRLKPQTAMQLLTATGKRLRETSRLLRHSASRNVNEAAGDSRTQVMKIADWISDFSGSLTFLFLHLGAFAVWIALNVQPLVHTPIGGFDPFPFGLLTMAVSLEAIVLSVFVLLSQNRQASRDRVRNEIEFEINLKAEMQIAHMHLKVDEMHAEILQRFEKIEHALKH